VIITGGYGLNVVANNYLIEQNPDVSFYFEPNADDTGNSMGAAWYFYRQHTSDKTPYPKNNTFYHHLDEQPVVTGRSATARDLAELLVKDRSIALYDGQPEAGPRALGHRSIIFDPRGRDAKDKVNEIKKREWYRPFAGIILEEYFEEYFETLGLKSSPEMTVSFKAKQIAIDNAPGVIHVDGTCRIQTVTEGYMAEVLREYHQITGVPILLNTSFNLAGAPLVHTKQDALDTLKDSMLDYVYFVQDDALINEHLCLSFEG
jgi:carbamoyltransferase